MPWGAVRSWEGRGTMGKIRNVTSTRKLSLIPQAGLLSAWHIIVLDKSLKTIKYKEKEKLL